MVGIPAIYIIYGDDWGMEFCMDIWIPMDIESRDLGASLCFNSYCSREKKHPGTYTWTYWVREPWFLPNTRPFLPNFKSGNGFIWMTWIRSFNIGRFSVRTCYFLFLSWETPTGITDNTDNHLPTSTNRISRVSWHQPLVSRITQVPTKSHRAQSSQPALELRSSSPKINGISINMGYIYIYTYICIYIYMDIYIYGYMISIFKYGGYIEDIVWDQWLDSDIAVGPTYPDVLHPGFPVRVPPSRWLGMYSKVLSP